MSIGAALKALMLAKDMTADALAEATGISRGAIYATMSGETMPLYSTVKRLAEALGVTTAQIASLADQIDQSIQGKESQE